MVIKMTTQKMDIIINRKKTFTQVIDKTMNCKEVYHFPKKINNKKILKEIFPYHKIITLI